MYVEEKLTITAIGAQLGVADQTVHNWLVAADIPRRPSPATARSDIDDEEVRRLYVGENCSAAEIAAHLGCAPSTVYRRLARSGVLRRPPVPRRGLRPEDDELGRLYRDEGLSLHAIAARYGVSAQAVRSWLIAAGVPRRAGGASTAPLDDALLVEHYRQGRTAGELARKFGCSSSTVYGRLEHAGVARRPPPVAIDRNSLLDGLEAGSSAPAIADVAGVSVTAVCRALKREGLHTVSQRARLDAARHQRALLARVAQRSDSP